MFVIGVLCDYFFKTFEQFLSIIAIHNDDDITMTTLIGLEWFFIDIDEFALAVENELNLSVSIFELSAKEVYLSFGKQPIENGQIFESLEIQGDHSKVLKEFLNESFCISEKFIHMENNNNRKAKRRRRYISKGTMKEVKRRRHRRRIKDTPGTMMTSNFFSRTAFEKNL